jgi:hypothetical protein
MSKAPYQIRTTHLDGSVTTDMIDNTNDNPKLTLDMYILGAPNTYEDTYSIEILDLNGNSLHTFNFIGDVERRVA